MKAPLQSRRQISTATKLRRNGEHERRARERCQNERRGEGHVSPPAPAAHHLKGLKRPARARPLIAVRPLCQPIVFRKKERKRGRKGKDDEWGNLKQSISLRPSGKLFLSRTPSLARSLLLAPSRSLVRVPRPQLPPSCTKEERVTLCIFQFVPFLLILYIMFSFPPVPSAQYQPDRATRNIVAVHIPGTY